MHCAVTRRSLLSASMFAATASLVGCGADAASQGSAQDHDASKSQVIVAMNATSEPAAVKVPELVLRNLLCLSEKCKQICLAADTYEVQIAPRFRLFPSLPTVLRHSERNSSFDKSQWQPPR